MPIEEIEEFFGFGDEGKPSSFNSENPEMQEDPLEKEKREKEEVAEKEKDAEIQEKIRKDWELFYKNEFGISVDLSQIIFPGRYKQEKGEFTRAIIVLPGQVTTEGIWQKCAKAFRCLRDKEKSFDESLIKDSSRDSDGQPYAIWIQDCRDISERTLGVPGKFSRYPIKLNEYLLAQLKCHKETGENLDKQTATICGGSHFNDWNGNIPVAGFGGKDGKTLMIARCRADKEMKNAGVREVAPPRGRFT